MPFVRISLPGTLSQVSKHEISKGVHKALIQEFNIPQDDYFHVIEELTASQLLYPEHYLGVNHTKNIVYVHIFAGAGRTLGQKERLYAQIAQNIAAATEILASDVIIILMENNGRENWSFGNGEIQEIKHL